MQASRAEQSALKQLGVGDYSTCVRTCDEALLVEPDNLPLRLLKTRALMGLRKDAQAKRELGKLIRRRPNSGSAHRLLGELAIRDGKPQAAQALLRQAVRLCPTDDTAHGLLSLVEEQLQLTVAVEKLPAATATVSCTLLGEATIADPTGRTEAAPGAWLSEASVTDPSIPQAAIAPHLDVDDADDFDAFATVDSGPRDRTLTTEDYELLEIGDSTQRTPRPRHIFPSGSLADGDSEDLEMTFERPPTGRPTDLFGRYLVSIGALTPLQLRATLDYHRIHRVKLGMAAVALGFVSEPSVEWAAHDFHETRAA